MPRRLRAEKIDTPEYYNECWEAKAKGSIKFDYERLEACLKYPNEPTARKRICDLGAGLFGLTAYLTYSSILLDIIGIDSSHVAKELVQKACPSVNYLLSDVLTNPLRDNWFDLVVAGELIEHMEEPEKLVAEMARLCRPDGWMVISTVNTESPGAIAHGPYEEHLWEFTPGDLTRYFEPYGETIYGLVGNYHFIWCRRY